MVASGSVIAELRVKHLPLALQYRLGYRLVSEEPWNTVYSSSSRMTVNGLEKFRDDGVLGSLLHGAPYR